jgi:NAD(P)-dependent dehydrogenase (short-subunit alcohol dehydrogenase family)
MRAKAPTWRSRISTSTRTRGHVADYAFCEAAVQQTIETFGHLDILVNNAAFQEHVNAIEELSEEQFDRTVKTNLYGYFHMTKAAVPHLKSGNAIVTTGSVTGIRGGKHLLDYSMTKGGIHAFARSLAAHLLDRGIRMNVIAPGPVWTPLNPADRPPEQVAKFGSQTRCGAPRSPRRSRPPSCSWRRQAARATSRARSCRSSADIRPGRVCRNFIGVRNPTEGARGLRHD